MSRIRGRGNRSTELALMKLFRRYHIVGWRRHQTIFGKPDFVFPKQKLAVFVDGCFWHGCSLHSCKPRNNAAFWRKKMASNKARDRKVTNALCSIGWRVLRIWEHQLSQRNQGRLAVRLQRLFQASSPS
jgi:DNA mismatch endonuclease (patch repair protein)